MVRLAVTARSPPVWPAVDRVLATAAEPAAAGRDSSQASAQSSVSPGPPWSVALGGLRTLSAAAVRCRGSSSKLRLSAFAEPLSTALALAHGSKGRNSRIERSRTTTSLVIEATSAQPAAVPTSVTRAS